MIFQLSLVVVVVFYQFVYLISLMLGIRFACMLNISDILINFSMFHQTHLLLSFEILINIINPHDQIIDNVKVVIFPYKVFQILQLICRQVQIYLAI